MAADTLRFYLDENLPIEVARQLQLRGIEATTARDLGQLGDSDLNHLQRATEKGMVLCTFDSDYVALAIQGIEHAGIVLGQQDVHHIGAWVRHLELMHAVYSPDEVRNHVEYL